MCSDCRRAYPSSLHSHSCEDSVSHYSSCPASGIAEWEILKQGQSFSECVSKLFQLPAAQQWMTPLPFCLLRGLQGGISPNYLYWSRETGEYQAGLDSLHSSYLSSSVFITPSPSLSERRGNIKRNRELLCERDYSNHHHTLLYQLLQWFTVCIQAAVIKPAISLLIFH